MKYTSDDDEEDEEEEEEEDEKEEEGEEGEVEGEETVVLAAQREEMCLTCLVYVCTMRGLRSLHSTTLNKHLPNPYVHFLSSSQTFIINSPAMTTTTTPYQYTARHYIPFLAFPMFRLQ